MTDASDVPVTAHREASLLVRYAGAHTGARTSEAPP